MRILVTAMLIVCGCGTGGGGPTASDDGGALGIVDGGSDDGGGGAVDAATSGSAGCGKSSTLATGMFVEQMLTVGGAARSYWLRLPAGYDPTRRYPIVYQLHGCSTSPNRQDNNPPTQNQSGSDAIHVRARAAADCWSTSPTGVDVAYIDALLPAVEGGVCVDTNRRFLAGYSSGAFMSHQLACIRGGLFRGVATIAGGQAGRNCTGNVAALLIHDTGDTTVNVSASIAARDNHLQRNGCGTTKQPVMPSPCEAYDGCDPRLPVVWCQTSGQNHSRQDTLAASAFWGFFSSLR
jgi:polyhydroxybutyrate depolymerase